MERHANKNNAPETIKVPLQQLSKSGKTIFAYMRRSTTKKEQASSLPQQEEWIENIAWVLWIELSHIRSYTESRSGYENRKRPEWNKMLEEIDKQKESCIILCRDTSRLSRNPTDNLAIANRMFGDNKQQKVISSIYYLGTGMKVEEWNEKTNKKHIVDTLHQNYTDSMENKEKCIGWVLLKLDAGEFPYTPPHGLSRVNLKWEKRVTRSEKTTLKQNEKMPFIRQAFEMKANGRPAKEICKYLKQYGNISISSKSIVETIIANTVYCGRYTEKTTGTFFENIKFWERNPPIDFDLWERANAKVGKRGYGFWDWQKDHIAPWLLKHENGKALSIYKAKGKYNAYQTEIKWENGERKSIGIMEKDIVKRFLSEVMPKIQFILYKINKSKELNDMIEAGEKHLERIKKGEISVITFKDKEWNSVNKISNKERETKITTDMLASNMEELNLLQQCNSYDEFNIKRQIDMAYIVGEMVKQTSDTDDINEMVNKGILTEEQAKQSKECDDLVKDYFLENERLSYQDLKNILNKSPDLEKNNTEKELRELKKKELEEQKKELEEQKRTITKNAILWGFSREETSEVIEDTEKAIKATENQINELWESTDIEQYLDRLPEIIQNLHELAGRVLSDGDYEWWRDDIKQLMGIVLHELTLTNKKELKIKLFDALEKLETGEIWNGAHITADTRTSIQQFVDNYDRIHKRALEFSEARKHDDEYIFTEETLLVQDNT